MNATTTTTTTTLWPCLTYRDARGAIAFLTDVFGFQETAVHTREDAPSIVEHAELRWPLGGGVMLGTAAKDESAWGRRSPGNDAVYVVCDEPDTLFDRAVAAGAEIVRGLVDEDYGSRGFTVRDTEGNLWSFGTYRGEGAAPKADRETFAALLDEWAAAIVSNDAEAIGRFATPDWMFVADNGITPGSTFLELVASGDLTHRTMNLEVERVASVSDSTVLVTTHGTNSGAFRGEPFTADEWATDVFVWDGERWRCTLTQLTPVKSPQSATP
ncbi:DUF4440 domain-containing protein [Streptomyces cupreus]|uniref:DUF4440 domain-containing protein n=1 Tax=Streptomyces cupreus TaxID=2759956 RepID=A0A7X1JCN5_9ACTN|nr:DUF4440 domain-containing protein [Streptomyces cupreus]MBC2907880.1 DUF4440 domain-containing protein [Streptomyces cupreus]